MSKTVTIEKPCRTVDGREDSVTFVFRVDTGFSSYEEAVSFIESLGFQASDFTFVEFLGLWYASHLESYYYELTFGKTMMWSKKGSPGTRMYYQNISGKETEEIKKMIPQPIGQLNGGHSAWNASLKRDLVSLNGGPLDVQLGDLGEHGEKDRWVKVAINNFQVELGICLFDTKIPVEKLSVVDFYFNSYFPSNDIEKHKKRGVVAVDPFKDILIYKKQSRN